MTSHQTSVAGTERPRGPRLIRRFAVPIILAWIGLIVLMAVAVPPLEKVAEERQVSLSPKDAPCRAPATAGHPDRCAPVRRAD